MIFWKRTGVAIAIVFMASSAQAKSPFAYETNGGLHPHAYIVQLDEAPLAIYAGGISGFGATSLRSNFRQTIQGSGRRLNLTSNDSKNYRAYLKQRQSSILEKAMQVLGRDLEPDRRYQLVLNGFALQLSADEAALMRQQQGVKSVSVAPVSHALTDRGPLLINAPAAWTGTATGVAAKGEGMIVGIIDTGIRHDHPSFSATDPTDGYVHTNPLGSAVFLGYCATNAGFCNDKLIGAYNFAAGVTDPEDENQHGTHVAATAAGNHLEFDLGAGNAIAISGVAPRANIIAYRIADATGASAGAASISAIEQAVADGVDVINYSFGSTAFNPWGDAIAVAYRNARAAGVIVVTSAGNEGPRAGSIGSPGDAPWLTTVAASTHDRGAAPGKSMSNMSGGSSTPPGTINGRSLTAAITAAIVYAGDFSNGDTNPEQCLTPFPNGTFSGQIVVCDRGAIARVEKAQNVAAGGAGGYVLANVQGGDSFLADDIYVVPGIHIAANDGDTLKIWLASGAGHTATINATNGPIGINPAAADKLAIFSSRGPNPSVNGVMKPSVSAPGVDILAADLAPTDFAFLSGTSMSSPHVAGAAALIKQLMPSWTAGQVHSALVTTGFTAVQKEDGTTAADIFDMGGGRVDIGAALDAGLLMDETVANFTNADPTVGGDPTTLNLPGMTNANCAVQCSWSRTVSAAVPGSWTASYVTATGLTLAAAPASFSLAPGQNQVLNVDADIAGSDGQWLFGSVLLTPGDPSTSATHLPVAVQVNNSNIPDSVSLTSQRNTGRHTFAGVIAIPASNVQAQGFMTQAVVVQKQLAADTDNSSAFDDLTDGVVFEVLGVAAGSKQLFAQTSNSTATDIDLFVGQDLNGNGQPDEFELIKQSTSPNADEQIVIDNPAAGNYWILVQNWAGAASGTDDYDYRSGIVSNTATMDLIFTNPPSSNGVDTFNIDMDFSNLQGSGSRYFGVVTLGTSIGSDDLGHTQFTLERVSDDVSMAIAPASVAAGGSVAITVTVSPDTSETRNYSVDMTLPSGLSVDAASLSNGATASGSTINWQAAVSGTAANFSFNATVGSTLAGTTVNLTANHSVDLANAQTETTSGSFTVSATPTGGGGNTGGTQPSGGGGALGWLLAGLALVAIGRKRKLLKLFPD